MKRARPKQPSVSPDNTPSSSATSLSKAAMSRPRRRPRLLWFTLPLTILILWQATSQARDNQLRDHHQRAYEVVRSYTVAASLYADEHGGQFPDAAHWRETLRQSTGAIPTDLPETWGGKGRQIAYNRAIVGRTRASLHGTHDAVLFFESTSPARDGLADLNTLLPASDPNRLILGFADSHIEDDQFPTHRQDILNRSTEATRW